eukprot:709165-Pelagomonas_calceolata.AAC.1
MFLLSLLTCEQSHGFYCCILDRWLGGGVDACLSGRFISFKHCLKPTCSLLALLEAYFLAAS